MPFGSFGLNPDLLHALRDLAFTRPTPIQAQAIPPAMAGSDLLACAATGSGKTAAFLLPILHHLLAHPRPGAGLHLAGPRALILTPTRELAAQIHQHFVDLAAHTSLTGAPIFGGVGMGAQEHAFRTGVELLIATPGRLLDHLRRPYGKLANLKILVLDEADRMLDMGFLPDIRRILRQVPAKRQTLFFSATMPPEIRQLTVEMLTSPVTVQIERHAGPAVGITQAVYPVPQHLKSALLLELLKNRDGAELASVICFTRTKHRANRLADYLKRHHIPCAPIHGNRSQAQRTAALAGFKAGQHRVLVATDIAARGIDVSGVSHVINFDCPHLAEDYIHRVGRTGRAEATGDAFTFVAPEEEANLRTIERAIHRRLPRVTLPNFNYAQQAPEKLEIPLHERLAAMRKHKSQSRAHHKQAGATSGQPPLTPAELYQRSSHQTGRSKPHLPGHGPHGAKHRRRPGRSSSRW
jgi:ATP-dependent RNA helicase RhlE